MEQIQRLLFSSKKKELEKANYIDEDNKVTKGYLLSSIISDYLNHQNRDLINPKDIKNLIKKYREANNIKL
jgi:hypothetical protein